jgi:hypothetical protein
MNPLTLLIVCASLLFFLFCPGAGMSMKKGPFKEIVIAFGGLLQEKITDFYGVLTWILYFKKTLKPSIAVAIDDPEKRFYADVTHYLVIFMGLSVAWTWSNNVRELTTAETQAIDELVAKEFSKQGDFGHESSSEVRSE